MLVNRPYKVQLEQVKESTIQFYELYYGNDGRAKDLSWSSLGQSGGTFFSRLCESLGKHVL